ncbi:MAG: ABC transporter substrate-binding protein [Acidobacteria bacterium]|nr:ABC transporter substrate-binding protein [Acidobacteriota bacterium]
MKIRYSLRGMVRLALIMFSIYQMPLRAQTPAKVRITASLSDVSINKIPFIVAENEGLYAKYGLEVVMTPFSASAARVHGVPDNVPKSVRDAVVGPNISIGGGAPGMWDKAISSEPNDRVIIGTTDDIVHWDIVAQPEFKRLEDLKGKRFAISGLSACTGTVALVVAKHMGWDPVQDMAILEGNYSITPLQKRWTDALIAYEVPLAMAMKAGYKPLDLDMRKWNEKIPCNGIWTSKSWAHANKATVIAYLKAVTEAISMMKKDKEVAFRAIAKYYDFKDREQQQVIYNGAKEMPRKPYPSVEGIKNAMKLYDGAAMRRFKAEDFYDDSFMKELDQSGFIDSLYK